jgi:hypothetical protein
MKTLLWIVCGTLPLLAQELSATPSLKLSERNLNARAGELFKTKNPFAPPIGPMVGLPTSADVLSRVDVDIRITWAD